MHIPVFCSEFSEFMYCLW